MSVPDITLAEALNQIGHIKDRIDKNKERIAKYSSMLSSEKPYFSSEEEQKKEVEKLVQSNMDLVTLYLKLKTSIEYTNMCTLTEIDGKIYSISDIVRLQMKAGKMIISTYESLDDKSAESRKRGVQTVEGKVPQVVRLYSEEYKNKNLDKWRDLVDPHGTFESRKRVLNATIKLKEFITPAPETV